jgi:hypothetical protein
MAHATSPANLTKQPTTSTARGIWQAIVAAIVVVALAAGIAVSANLATRTSAAPVSNPNVQIQSQPGVNVHKIVGHKGAMIYQ